MVEISPRTGITDPTLGWVDKIDTFQGAPGVDIIEAMASGNEGVVPKSGYIIDACIHPEVPRLTVDLYRYIPGGLALHELRQKIGGGRVGVLLPGETRTRIACADPRDRAIAYLPRSSDGLVRLSEESGQVVALTDPQYAELDETRRRVFHAYNPLTTARFDPREQAIYASSVIAVETREGLTAAFNTLGRAHGLVGLDLGIFCGAVARRAFEMDNQIAEEVTAQALIDSPRARLAASAAIRSGVVHSS